MSIVKEVGFDKNTTSLDSLKKAAYRFIDHCSVEFVSDDSRFVCLLHFSSTVSEEAAMLTVEDFRKEVLDQDLRASIKVETEAIRNLILAHAFSKTGISNDE